MAALHTSQSGIEMSRAGSPRRTWKTTLLRILPNRQISPFPDCSTNKGEVKNPRLFVQETDLDEQLDSLLQASDHGFLVLALLLLLEEMVLDLQ